jgi:hypothetical protein
MRFAMVFGMPEEYMDPSGNTQQFKAFAARQEPPAPAAPSRLPLVIGAAVAAVVVVALIVWFAVS